MWDDARLSAFQGFAPIPGGGGGLGSSSVAGAALAVAVAVAVQAGGVSRVTAPDRGPCPQPQGVAAEQRPRQHLRLAAAP